jgi:hypothetical protein
MKKHTRYVAALLLTIAPLLASASENSPSPTKQLSVEEYLVQKDIMIKDLSAKIDVLQDALNCANASKTPGAFLECNEALRKKIVTTMQPK